MNFKRYLLSLLSIFAFAASTYAYSCKTDGIYYYLDGVNNTALVTYNKSEYPSYKGIITIPDTITFEGDSYTVISIGKFAFASCRNLTSINIPNSVTTIGKEAFTGCNNLTSIYIPNSVTHIDKDAFKSCKSLKEIIISMDYTGTIPDVGQDIIKWRKPTETIEEYLAIYPFISWENYYAEKHTKNQPQIDNFEIADLISKELEEWQKKGEFETTAQWNNRVNEKSRICKIDSLKQHYIEIAHQEQNEYQQEIETLQKSYERDYKQHYETLSNRYIAMLIKLKKLDFEKDSFVLNSPYDADNQSFLISSNTLGDILLPVPISEAPSFKKNWDSIKSKITPTYVFNGKDAILSKLTFSNNGKDYVYDSHTEAKYAVADINYNFAPLEIKAIDFDIKDIDIIAPEIEKPDVAQTLAKESNAIGIDKKKIDIRRQSITIGSGSKKSDVDVTIPHVERNADKTFALIIANENYRREGNVPYALNDGKILAEYFKSTIGIPEKNIQLYTDASLNDIKYGINQLSQICDAFGNQASIIVYYAGHGIPDEKSGNAHLLPIDGYSSDVSTGYSLRELYETLGSLQSKQTLLLLDACFSGAQRDGTMMANNARGVRIKTKTYAANGNLIVLSATQGDETAYPYEEKQHGLFTYFLLKKLNENKGNVTLGDLADYIITNVKQTSIISNNKIQTPNVTVSPDFSSSWKALQFGQ